MDRNTIFILNDLLDAVDKLTEIVKELNPGATNQFGFIEFTLARVERQIEEAQEILERS